MTGPATEAGVHSLRQIPLSYNNADSERSALRLVYSLFPEWETEPGEVRFTRFTDGITNTLLKAAKWRPEWTPEQVDEDAILLRAYGRCTEVLIDREKETNNHRLLAARDLAPPLLAQFKNGLMYRFIRGQVCSAYDLQQEPVWRAVARRLGEWHARMPVQSRPAASNPADAAKPAYTNGVGRESASDMVELALPTYTTRHSWHEINSIAPGKLAPNPWTVMQKWIFALPGDEPGHTADERKQKQQLQAELRKVVAELSDEPGIGVDGFVLAHCDLLCGNVIVEPRRNGDRADRTATAADRNLSDFGKPDGTNVSPNAASPSASSRPAASASASTSVPAAQAPFSLAPAASAVDIETVSFIDYEYATPGPAAFDLANHFAEWGGLDCDYAAMPTRAVRRAFLREYLCSYRGHLAAAVTRGERTLRDRNSEAVNGHDGFDSDEVSDAEVDALFELVDRFRGVPGLYWGIWALIQALISQIDFDYPLYAQKRLSEYTGFRATQANGGKPVKGDVREERWARED